MIIFIYWLKPKEQPSIPQSAIPNQTITNQDSDNQQIENNDVVQNIKIDKFVPNLIWKDKTLNINGKELDYKFGQGNPEEVALKPEDYLAKGEKDGLPYVTKEAEKNLKDFLSDEDLPAILDKCENYNRQNMIKLNPNIPINQLPILLNPSDFDIENIMTVNTETGRKEINADIANRINEFLNTLSNPLEGTEFGDKCAGTAYSQSIEKIIKKFSILNKSYLNGGAGIKGYEWPN